VIDVVDGDTVKVAYRGQTSVWVIGIDAPETVDPSSPVECGGPRASQLASKLLTGKRVKLVFDPPQGRKDQYDRTLAYLDAPGLGDFGLAMIQRGGGDYTYDTSYARPGQVPSPPSSALKARIATCGTTAVVRTRRWQYRLHPLRRQHHRQVAEASVAGALTGTARAFRPTRSTLIATTSTGRSRSRGATRMGWTLTAMGSRASHRYGLSAPPCWR